MATSDVQLCSAALIKLGAHPISSLTEASAEAEVARTLYPFARDALLCAHPWNFATAQARLQPASVAPLADYQHAYRLPDDYLAARALGMSGTRGHGARYRVIGDVLHTNGETALLTYLFRPREADFPVFFTEALIARLAAEFCLPITENPERAELLWQQAELALRGAKRVDSQEDTPPMVIEDFSLIEARRV